MSNQPRPATGADQEPEFGYLMLPHWFVQNFGRYATFLECWIATLILDKTLGHPKRPRTAPISMEFLQQVTRQKERAVRYAIAGLRSKRTTAGHHILIEEAGEDDRGGRNTGRGYVRHLGLNLEALKEFCLSGAAIEHPSPPRSDSPPVRKRAPQRERDTSRHESELSESERGHNAAPFVASERGQNGAAFGQEGGTPVPKRGHVRAAPPYKNLEELASSSCCNKGGTPVPPYEPVGETLRHYGFVTDKTVSRMVDRCKTKAPDVSLEEVCWLIGRAGSKLKGRTGIDRPVGWIMSVVVEELTPQSLIGFRTQKAEEDRLIELDRQRVAAFEANKAAQDRVTYRRWLTDPEIPDSERIYVQGLLAELGEE